MNFDNPVYRKTTADEVSLSIDRQQYQPVYPSVHIPQNQSPVSCLITFLSLTSGSKFVLLIQSLYVVASIVLICPYYRIDDIQPSLEYCISSTAYAFF